MINPYIGLPDQINEFDLNTLFADINNASNRHKSQV